MSACPWTLEDCAIWKAVTLRMQHRNTYFQVQRMRDTFHDGDRRDYDVMLDARINKVCCGVTVMWDGKLEQLLYRGLPERSAERDREYWRTTL